MQRSDRSSERILSDIVGCLLVGEISAVPPDIALAVFNESGQSLAIAPLRVQSQGRQRIHFPIMELMRSLWRLFTCDRKEKGP